MISVYFGQIIIHSELFMNVINEIKPETLVEWYCLTRYDIKLCKIDWKVPAVNFGTK
jgi:hypothetical protein